MLEHVVLWSAVLFITCKSYAIETTLALNIAHCTVLLENQVECVNATKSEFMMSSNKRGVPCPCPFCKGKIVSTYMRHQYVRKFCQSRSDSCTSTADVHVSTETRSDSPVCVCVCVCVCACVHACACAYCTTMVC